MEKVNPPKTHPRDYGAKAGDYHLVINAAAKTMKAYSFSDGKLLWEIPALAEGQDPRWWVKRGDTPPSVYYLGTFYDDKATGEMTTPYGWGFFDFVDCEGREDGNGREGVGMHGGGSGLPDPFAPRQELWATHGCVRIHNEDVYRVRDLYLKGRCWVSVTQDDR